MCGIYGTIGENSHAGSIVHQGLKRLEYRGYDSWGVVVTQDDGFFIEKQVEKIDQAQKDILPPSQVALGHTRWATHGGVTQKNAHPHLALNNSFALVQNGVVENFQSLKAEFAKTDYQFISQTDTEVIVALLEGEMLTRSESEPSITTLCAVFKKLEGRNTIAVVTKSGKIIAIRQGSPLLLGKKRRKKGTDFFISSDVLSLAPDANEYFSLDHNQGVVIETKNKKVQAKGFEVEAGKKFAISYQPIQVSSLKIDKAGHPHFMLKEIYEQAVVFPQVVEQPSEKLEKLAQVIKQAHHVYLLGAGSASFAAGQLGFWLRSQGVLATALKSYEARSYRNLFHREDVCIVFSQSGETADTNEVVEWLVSAGVKIVSIVNMPGSTLTSFSDLPFMLQVGPEVGVASTKALSGQMVWSKLISSLVAHKSLSEFKKQVKAYSTEVKEWLSGKNNQVLQKLAADLLKEDQLFVLGRGELYMPALEFALKMKEISYIHAEGFSGGELKHGVIALIKQGTPVVCLVAEDEDKNEMLSAAAEVKARGARVIGVSAKKNDLFDDWIQIPSCSELMAISSFLPSQLLAYYLAVKKGFNPDKPRNLAKSVTVK